MKNSINTDKNNCFLIIGAGNLLLSDEGIGIHIVRAIEKLDIFMNASFVDIGTSSLDISMHLNSSVKKAVIIDCIKAEGYLPGTVFKLSIEDLRKRQLNSFSLHQFELVDSLKLLDISGDLPETIIFGVVPHNIEKYSLELSPEMQKLFDDILIKIKNEISIFFTDNA